MRAASDTATPLVSVLVNTYMHEEFVEDCLNGILGQEVAFAVEVIVLDDASTDGTQDILREYDRRFPGIFRLVLRETNQFTVRRPTAELLYLARAPFIAICEGDDYWISPRKLQDQVNLLQADSRLSWSGHPVVELTQGVGVRDQPLVETRRYPANDIELLAVVPTVSMVFRHFGDWPRADLEGAPYPDVVLKGWLASRGDCVVQGERLAVYRLHPGGISSAAPTISNVTSSVTSRLLAAQALYESDAQTSADRMVAGTVSFILRHYQDTYRTDVRGILRRESAGSKRVFEWLRVRLRSLPLVRRVYFSLLGRPDPAAHKLSEVSG